MLLSDIVVASNNLVLQAVALQELTPLHTAVIGKHTDVARALGLMQMP